MKSKTLIVLLIVPFIIALLSFISVVVLNNTVAADIVGINWDYQENEGFKINSKVELKASPILPEGDLLMAEGSTELHFYSDDQEIIKIVEEDNKSYLHALKEGNTTISVKNKRGTKSQSFNAFVYKNGAIIINPKLKANPNSILKNRTFGQFDPDYNELKYDALKSKMATFTLDIETKDLDSEIISRSLTPMVANVNNNVVSINNYGTAQIEVSTLGEPYISSIYQFEVIEGAYNIYSYDDLMMCTNLNKEGKPVVLQTSLESLDNTYIKKNDRYIDELANKNNALYGHFDFNKQKVSFDLYEHETNYVKDYIKQYNEAKKTDFKPNVLAGIRLQKSLYGNGFIINSHNLSYPVNGTYNESGKLYPSKELDHFFGPLPFVTIGDLSEMPIVKAYGQDNSNVYIDGDNITIDNVSIRNSNEIDNMYNLTYVGNVVDVNGKNNVIKNSILSNGRIILRVFSSDNFLLDNSILKTAAEFLMVLGNNEFNKTDKSKNVKVNYQGNEINKTFTDFFDDLESSTSANKILDSAFSKESYTEAELNSYLRTLNDIQEGLDNLNNIIVDDEIKYHTTANVKNSYFYKSGIFSIAFESVFNGAYLYSGLPSTILSALEYVNALAPNDIGGTSYPTYLNIDKNTKFYDWKDVDKIDVSALIEENISPILSQIVGDDVKISIDDFFPMKRILKEICQKEGYSYQENDKTYVNSKFAWYGGSNNLSNISIDKSDYEELDMSNLIPVDIAKSFLEGNKTIGTIATIISRCVIMATGFHPFKFITNGVVNGLPEDFNKVPTVDDLRNNIQ